MSVVVKVEDLTRVRDLFVLYGKKGAFNLEEFADVGAVYKNVAAALEGADEAKEVDLTKKDVTYVLSAINVCSQRAPVEVQNYKPIASLFDTLSEALKAAGTDDDVVEEIDTKPRSRK